MSKKLLDSKLVQSLTEASIEALSRIVKLAVIHHGPDAAAAVRSGGKLLGISRVDNDDDGDGFRYLVGLEEGTPVNGYLSNFF